MGRRPGERPTRRSVRGSERHLACALRDILCAFGIPCALLLVAWSRPIAAQHVVEGRVVSAANGAPLEDVAVRVVGEDLTVGTDSAGVFRFELPADRPGVALEVGVIGYEPFERTWILPLDRSIAIGLRQEAVELEGIDVEVDQPMMSLPEILEYRVKSLERGISRTAGTAELRSFRHQEADIWDFLPQMTVATGVGCDSCYIANGRVEPEFIVDDLEVSWEEFRTYAVEEVCRVDVVTFPVAGSRIEQGFVMAYTCQFLRDVAMGKRNLPLLLTNIWDWNQ